MGTDLIDEVALEEIKKRLVSVEEKQDIIIGHLESLEALLLSLGSGDKEVTPEPVMLEEHNSILKGEHDG